MTNKKTLRLPLYIIMLCAGATAIAGCGTESAPAEEASITGTAPEPEPLDRILALATGRANPYAAEPPEMPDQCERIKVNPLPGGALGRVFNDSNYIHLDAVQRIGITPITTSSDAWHIDKPIVRVESCEAYYIDKLDLSLPYLIPVAEKLLHDIGIAFRDTLRTRGGGDYRIKVTSLLRTESSVSRLRRRNRNAVEQSAHLYGTTFDVSYVKFAYDGHSTPHTQEDLKNILGEVLYAMREQGRCFVKYERKQGCFHISVRSRS